MLYQRRSTTYELMSLDETAGTSGAAGATAGPSTGLAPPADEGAVRRQSSSKRSRAARVSASSAENEAFDGGSERRRRKSRHGSTMLEVDEDGRRAARRQHRGSGESRGSKRRGSKEPPDLLDSNIIVELASDADGQSSPAIQMDTLHLPRRYASSRASCSSADGSSPSAASRRIDPTMTTTISEMIADDYVNDDDDSFAIFREEFDTDKHNRLRYDYVRKGRKEKSQKRNRPHDNAAGDYSEENHLLPHDGNERSDGEDEEEEEEDEDNSSYVGEELDELEQYEIGDRLGELLPVNYGRRSRREGVPSLARQAQLGSWDGGDYSSLDMNEPTPLEFSSISENPSKRSEDEESDEQSGIRKYAKLILPHVGLVVLTCVYTLVGASVFYSVENPNELATKRQQLNLIYAQQAEFVSALLRLAGASNMTGAPVASENWSELARVHMHTMSDQLFIAFDKYFLTANEVKRNTTKEIWTFSTALFFSVTVVTTIGYGNPVPVTQLGRLMCIGFSLFGIPLTLVTIADMGKFLSERLIWAYGKYLRLKYFLRGRLAALRHKDSQKPQPSVTRFKFKERPEHVCDDCEHRGLSQHMHVVEEQRIPALLVFGILVLYTALGGVLMSLLEPWSFFTSFYWSFITMTTVGFGDLMPRRDQYMYLILLYIILGLAITTMCIDLVGVQYIRKIHYFGRKIQDARSALAVVGGKVVLVSELYASLMQKRARNSVRDAFIIDNLYVSKHIIPYIPSDIRFIRYIDDHRHHRHRHPRQGGRDSQPPLNPLDNGLSSISSSTASSLRDLSSCRFCHSRFSISNHK